MLNEDHVFGAVVFVQSNSPRRLVPPGEAPHHGSGRGPTANVGAHHLVKTMVQKGDGPIVRWACKPTNVTMGAPFYQPTVALNTRHPLVFQAWAPRERLHAVGVERQMMSPRVTTNHLLLSTKKSMGLNNFGMASLIFGQVQMMMLLGDFKAHISYI